MSVRFCDTFIDPLCFKIKKGFREHAIPRHDLVRRIENIVIERNIIVEMFDLDRNTLIHPYYDYDDKRSCHPSLSDEEFVTRSTEMFDKAIDYVCSIYSVYRRG